MKKFDLNQLLKDYKEKIDIELRSFFHDRVNIVNNISSSSKEMMEHLMEYNLRGGKRLRPVLTILGYKFCGGKNENEIIKASIAVELMQSFLLMHDDIMDQDELRRGYLTMHKIYEKKAERYYDTDSKRFGESMAIIAGDILASLGTEAILSADFPVEYKNRAIDKFNRVIINTCFGQILDILSELEPIDEKTILKTHELKTAIYTIEGPLHVGALLAGASKKQLDILTKYAIPLGQAFQIQDDILGMFGTREKIGKPIGSDIKEGKRTLLILKALEKADDEQKQFILKCLGNRKISDSDIERARKIITETGALDYTRNLAKEFIEKAKKEIINVDRKLISEEGKEFLLSVADFIVERNN